jgi:hypothetical protein
LLASAVPLVGTLLTSVAAKVQSQVPLVVTCTAVVPAETFSAFQMEIVLSPISMVATWLNESVLRWTLLIVTDVPEFHVVMPTMMARPAVTDAPNAADVPPFVPILMSTVVVWTAANYGSD